MKVVTAEEMRRLDQAASAEFGIPSLILMENAGLKVMESCLELLGGKARGRRVLIFTGKGNNGGDGFVAARHLSNAGAEVKLFLLCRPEDIQGDALVNFRILQSTGLNPYLVQGERDLKRVEVALFYCDLVVDAIFGTGFKGAVLGLGGRVIELLNASGKPIVAVDLPSGLEADTGKFHGQCVKALLTVTMGLPKLGLVLEPGAGVAGRLVVADISIPSCLLQDPSLKYELIDEDFCASRLPLRLTQSHKGDFGHVLLVGGSPGLSGAIYLAGEAAIKSGAGLVTLGVPVGLNPILEVKTTEVMTHPLPEVGSGGMLGLESLDALLELLEQATAVVIGPGLGRGAEVTALVKEFLTRVKVPLVIDADALNALAEIFPITEESGAWDKGKVQPVLTPHPGEMSRLLSKTTAHVQADRYILASRAASRWGAVVVLKGARTVIAAPDGRVFINPTGNPGLASGGTGDVLSGMVGALLAQGLPPVEASALAVFAHGRAGDRAATEAGEIGLTATRLLHELPPTWLEMERWRSRA